MALIHTLIIRLFLFIILLRSSIVSAQVNLLLNGGFEDVNTCTEYNSECGVEGWFYLKDVKAQMLSNDKTIQVLGNNSFGIFYNWTGYTGFSPVTGTILPCGLQAKSRYTFKGIIAVKLNPQLIFKPGICMGEKLFVPQRPFSKNMQPDSIIQISAIPNSNFHSFEYSFIADGKEKYLTFGSYISEDTTGARKKLIGIQTVSIVLDNFALIPDNKNETVCLDFLQNKEKIYNYNFRHKEMDYSLFGKGELAINLQTDDSNHITQIQNPAILFSKPDTLQFGDVFFDFNKADLKLSAVKKLEDFFIKHPGNTSIDSLYIEGHTDSIGTDIKNQILSAKRCESIKQWLLANNILSISAIQIHPYGETRPLATNKTPEGRALNRRVEMIVFRNSEK